MEKGTSFDHTAPPQGILPLRPCSPCHQLLFLFNFSSLASGTSFGTTSSLINEHWCFFDGLVFCPTNTAGTNYYTILKSDNQVHISFYTFFVHFISLVNSLQNSIASFPRFSSFLFWSTNFILHTLVGWWLFMSFDWTFFLLQTLTFPCTLQCFEK